MLNLFPTSFWMLEFGDSFDFWRPGGQFRDLPIGLGEQQRWEYAVGFCCRLREIMYARPTHAISEVTHNILSAEEAQINRRFEYERQRKLTMEVYFRAVGARVAGGE